MLQYSLDKVRSCVNLELFSSKVADSKREEFRKYLEKAGVMDALTKGTFLRRICCTNLAAVAKFWNDFVDSSCEFVRGTGETG